MTFDQLRIFVAVAERLHMTRAAQALNITQSAASAAVATLEARYGARLFDRVGRGLELSEAGALFLPEARAVLARAAGAEQVLQDLAGLRRGAVRIHASQTVGGYWLPPRLLAFKTAHPEIAVTIAVENTLQAAQAVLAGDADLAVVEGEINEPALSVRTVGGDRLALLVAADHPWADGRVLTPSDLLAQPWVLRETGSGTRAQFEVALVAVGVDPARLDVVLEFPSNGAVRAAAVVGGAATALSELAVEQALKSRALVRANFAFPERRFHLLRHKERAGSHASRALARMLADQPE